MDRSRRKDGMDGGVATQRAKDLLAPLRGEVENITDLEDAREIDWATRERNLAEYLRGAYAEGYAEGLAAEDTALARNYMMKAAYDQIVKYVRESSQTTALNEVIRTLYDRFDTVVRERLDLSDTKHAQLLAALLGAVRAAAPDMRAASTD